MSLKRVQKLLFSEYCDFEDMVLLESPFAQTTREGKGLRQVHLGLTPSKFIIATDILPPAEKSLVFYIPGIDPIIETFELIAVYPIDCINLSIFRRHKRQTVKAHFCNNRVFYFELGGFENRNMFWNLWCEKVKFLSPESGSSHSETSVATSSTCSTLYLVDSRQVVKPNGLSQIWCKFGTGKNYQAVLYQSKIVWNKNKVEPKWTDRYVYLGKNNEDHFKDYSPIMTSPKFSQFISPKPIANFSIIKKPKTRKSECNVGDWYPINRFASGIKEGCKSSLYLPCENYIVPKPWSKVAIQSSDSSNDEISPRENNTNNTLADHCVKAWENSRSHQRHRRRYAFTPQPLLLYGLGPWNINPGAKYSIQVKRAVSVVTIRRQPSEPELRLPVTKRQLVATVSCETLQHDKIKINQASCVGPRRSVIFFWTPNYWYRPRSAKDAYQELQTHLNKLRQFQQRNKKKRRIFRRRAPKPSSSESNSSENSSISHKKSKKQTSIIQLFGRKSQDICDTDRYKCAKETSLQYLKRILKLDIKLSAWDFNSTTLAQQLTMIDRDLFLKISGVELMILARQQCSKNAPNIAAMVAFSHRVTCLVATDILGNDTEKMRARLISRFVTVAEKCHRISNFQSCRTVLYGLQSPAIYRLKSTWAYVRKKHATKYRNFEYLSKLYKDPRLLTYQRMFYFSSRTTPYLPFIGDIIAKLLDRIPLYKIPGKHKPHNSQQSKEEDVQAGLLPKLLASIKLTSFTSDFSGKKINKSLCAYYTPLNCCEENRLQCLAKTTDFLQQCQLSALHYNFQTNNLATDYLLKTRYKEEKSNFYQSLKIES